VTDSQTYDTLPTPAVRRRRRGRPSIVWVVPILAALAAAFIIVRSYILTGPRVEVSFENAEGLEAGKSEVRYKNVPIGRVSKLALSSDLGHIIATIELDRSAEKLATRGTQFWIERPRIGIGGVSGLSTLVSGPYISVSTAGSDVKTETFVGLERAPGVTSDARGKTFRLTASDAGSLAVRSPVYLHRVAVGWVSAIDLAPDGKRIDLEVFVEHPYENTVTTTTVFWNAGGLDVSLDATGLRLDTQSLATVIAGGIAFDVRDPELPAAPADILATFTLFDDRDKAMATPDGLAVRTAMRFHGESMRGVSVGAPLDLEGVPLGKVDKIELGYDPTAKAMFTDIRATVYPERLGAAYAGLLAEKPGASPQDVLDRLVERGLRAQIRSGNLITGQGYIALAWIPAPKGDPGKLPPAIAGVWIVPTEPGGVDRLQRRADEIAVKVDGVLGRVDGLFGRVDGVLGQVDGMLGRVDREVLPEAVGAAKSVRELVAPDSALVSSARSAIQQVERAAYALRSFADYLERHPEAIVRGRE